MGMKKSSALGLMAFAMAMSATTDDSFAITERGNVGNGKQPGPIKRKEPTPFNKQDGVLKMINDFKLIIEGKSKKNHLKQMRIKRKIDEWLEKGFLNLEDLELP